MKAIQFSKLLIGESKSLLAGLEIALHLSLAPTVLTPRVMLPQVLELALQQGPCPSPTLQVVLS